MARAFAGGVGSCQGTGLNMAATLSPTPFVPATLDHPDCVVTSRCLLVAYSSFPAWWPGGQRWRSCFGRMAAIPIHRPGCVRGSTLILEAPDYSIGRTPVWPIIEMLKRGYCDP